MLMLPLGIISLLSSLGLFAYVQSNEGSNAAVTVSGQVLTGPALYLIAVLLGIAGVLFIIGALLKTVRKIVGLIAVLTMLSGGGVAALVPDSVSDYVKQHCPQRMNSLPSGTELTGCANNSAKAK